MTVHGQRVRRSGVAVMTAAIIASCLIVRVGAHEHHTDNIPEGEYVSPDPLVSQLRS